VLLPQTDCILNLVLLYSDINESYDWHDNLLLICDEGLPFSYQTDEEV
jgi:hypothetical protein